MGNISCSKATCKQERTELRKILLAIVLMLAMAWPLTIQAASQPLPGKVTLTKISSPAYNKVTIQWKKTSNATHYKIYYKKYGSSKWIGLKTLGSSAVSFTHTASTSKPVEIGQKYVYTVRAYNSKTKKYGTYDAKGLSAATKPDTVKLGKASLNDEKMQVTLTWSKAGGADRYMVYRKTVGSSWKKLATVNSRTLNYTDKAPVPGVVNTYTVRSYYSKTKVYGRYNTKGINISVPYFVSPEDIYLELCNYAYVSDDGRNYTLSAGTGDTLELALMKNFWTLYPSKWTSSNPKVATVECKGDYANVKLLKMGSTTIKAVPKGKYIPSKSVEITVGFSERQKFADEYVQKWVRENLTEEMSDYDKMNLITKDVAKIPYGGCYDWINGLMNNYAIDCYASRQMVAYMCTAVGIPALACDAFEHHGETIVKADGRFYMVGTGYTGADADYYRITEMTESELQEYLRFYKKTKADFTPSNKGICDATEHACWDTHISLANPELNTYMKFLD